MAKVYQFERYEKCGGCNWEVAMLYVLADTKRIAYSLLRSGDAGLCGDCFSEMLEEGKYEVTSRKSKGFSRITNESI